MTRTLVVSTGLSPQVVTEALWWLAINQVPAWTPDRIAIITTALGAQRVFASLLPGGSDKIRALGHDYGRDDLVALADSLHVEIIGDDVGGGFPDVDSYEAHRAAADQTMSFIRDLTSKPGDQIHASIAGGRKSQGAILALSMSMFGQRGDSLSHLMVDERFVGHPDYFYPPPRPGVLLGRDGSRLDTSDAHLRLALIPFPRLRAQLPQSVFGASSYADAIENAQLALDPVTLTVNPSTQAARINGSLIRLPPSLFAWLAALAWDRLHDGVGLPRTGLAGSVVGRWRAVGAPLPDPLDPEWVQEWTSRLNKLVRRDSQAHMRNNLVESIGQRPHTRYRLAIERSGLFWED